MPVILGFSAVGIFLTTDLGRLDRAERPGAATVFGIFGGFWLSYGALLLGTLHGWFGVTPASVQAAKELYLVVWLVVIVTLTLSTLRLHLIYTAVFFFVDLALLLVFLGVNEDSAGLSKAGGYVALVFAALGVYLYAGTIARLHRRPRAAARPSARLVAVGVAGMRVQVQGALRRCWTRGSARRRSGLVSSRSAIQSRRVVSQPGSPCCRARSLQKTCCTAPASPGSSCSCNSGRGSSGSQPVSDRASRAAS